MLRFFKEVYCVSSEDLYNLRNVYYELNGSVMGDTRYDQVFYRIQNPKPVRDELKPTDPEKVLVAGSTWPDDERVLLEVLKALKAQGLRCVLVPHEPSSQHIRSLKHELTKHDISFSVYSEASDFKTQCLIVDQVGILAELYAWGKMAFVGNSFVDHKVHSVMEPLSHGCITFVGPYYHNNREAIDFSKIKFGGGFSLCQPLQGVQQANEKIGYLLENSGIIEEISQHIRENIAKRVGASERIANKLFSYSS